MRLTVFSVFLLVSGVAFGAKTTLPGTAITLDIPASFRPINSSPPASSVLSLDSTALVDARDGLMLLSTSFVPPKGQDRWDTPRMLEEMVIRAKTRTKNLSIIKQGSIKLGGMNWAELQVLATAPQNVQMYMYFIMAPYKNKYVTLQLLTPNALLKINRKTIRDIIGSVQSK